jgi:hypothetical protein
MRTFVCTHIYIYILCTHNHKQHLRHDHNITPVITKRTLKHTYIFEKVLFPNTVVQQRQHMDAVECLTIFSMSVHNILQTPSEEIQICSSCSASTYNSPGYGSAVYGNKWQKKISYQAKGPEIKFCVIFHHGFIRICGQNGCTYIYSKSIFNNGVVFLQIAM